MSARGGSEASRTGGQQPSPAPLSRRPSSFNHHGGAEPAGGAGSLDSSPLCFKGRRIYAATQRECVEACRALEALLLKQGAAGGAADKIKVLGFDIEWRIYMRKGVPPGKVATVQLAADELAVIFQISSCGGSLPDALAKLLSQPDVLKVGVGVQGDVIKLEQDFGGRSRGEELLDPAKSAGTESASVGAGGGGGEAKSNFRVRGALDLNEVALRALATAAGGGPEAPPPQQRPKGSLGVMCQELLGQSLPKPSDVRLGNWEATPLSESQLAYAATDAWAGVRCFRALQARAPGAVAELAAAIASGTEPEPPATFSAKKRPRPETSQPVEAAAVPKDLPPTKRMVYRLFHEKGLTAQSIAELRGIQVHTVYGYLVDAVAAGYAFDLAEFALSADDQAAITAALAKAEEAAAAADGKMSIKTVKEALPEHIEYWAIKLVQVHAERTKGKKDEEEGEEKKPEAQRETSTPLAQPRAATTRFPFALKRSSAVAL